MTDRDDIAGNGTGAAPGSTLAGGHLVIASHNPGKLREIDELLAPLGIATLSAASLGLPEPAETGTSFAANARLKAKAAANASGLPALSDDSGLEVVALGGQPGIHSARWAEPVPGGRRDFRHAMQRVAEALDFLKARDRRARFVCALALAIPAPGGVGTRIFEGTVEGVIVWPPRGDRGFGYDPVFQPCGFDITFGEMDPARKHAMSHRAAAFRQLVAACFS